MIEKQERIVCNNCAATKAGEECDDCAGAGCSRSCQRREPVASPQATRPDSVECVCDHPDYTGAGKIEPKDCDAKVHKYAAQPAVGTTPCRHTDIIGHEWSSTCQQCGETWQHRAPEYTTGNMNIGLHKPSEGTTPQAERLCARCGCDKATHEVEISRSGRTSGFCYAHPETCAAFEARAVAPVETPDADFS